MSTGEATTNAVPAYPAPSGEMSPQGESRHHTPGQPLAGAPSQDTGPAGPALYNRIGAVIEHIPWYSFRTQVRLAQDSRVSEAAISRLLRGECQPSLVVALQVTQAIERRLGRPLDVRELFSLDGRFPTPSPCQLVGCPNCLSELFYDDQDTLKPECQDIKPGQWSLVQPHPATPLHRVMHLLQTLTRKEALTGNEAMTGKGAA